MNAVKKGEKCPHCGEYFSRELTVNGIVVKGGQILLIKRGIEPSKGKWALPGGYIDWGETVEEAAIREVREESGVQATIDYLVGIYSSPQRREVIHENVSLTFAMTIVDATTKAQEEEVEEIQWFDLNHIPEDIAFDHADMIKDYQRKEENGK